jgi:hypothetical protein
MYPIWGRGEVHTGVLWGKLREKSPIERPRCRWKENIKLNLQDMGWRHGLD